MEKLSLTLTIIGVFFLLGGVSIFIEYFTGISFVPIPPNPVVGIILLVVGGAAAAADSILDRKRGVKRRW